MARYVYPVLLVAWVGAFAFQAVQAARHSARLAAAAERLESEGSRMNGLARELAALSRQARADEAELEFLHDLPNLLPQDPGYLRTQKAISDEVGVLRRQVGGRLKGDLHIVVDAKANKLYLKQGLKLLWQADCSVGRGGILVDKKTGRRWEFVTPRGEFRVLSKLEAPAWVKPDWAFVEAGQPVPPPDDPSRKEPGVLGAYVLNLGDGYLIHGTKDESQLGRPASHGCVRLGADNLKSLYETVPVGTRVFIIG